MGHNLLSNLNMQGVDKERGWKGGGRGMMGRASLLVLSHAVNTFDFAFCFAWKQPLTASQHHRFTNGGEAQLLIWKLSRYNNVHFRPPNFHDLWLSEMNVHIFLLSHALFSIMYIEMGSNFLTESQWTRFFFSFGSFQGWASNEY